MSDPNSPEAMKPETSATEAPDNAAAGSGAAATPGTSQGSGTAAPPKAQAYVDPEIAAEARIMAWEAEKSDLTDKLMRAHAEMDNLRKRTEREKADMAKYAITKFAGDMLAVADNLDRALAALPEAEEFEPQTKALVQGVELTSQDLKKALEGSDKDVIETKTQALAEASSKLAEKAYSAGAEDGEPDPVDANASAQSDATDDVVDAEFEEVKEDDKK